MSKEGDLPGEAHIRKKLDRCMPNPDSWFAYPHALVEILPLHNFVHNPLLLSFWEYLSL